MKTENETFAWSIYKIFKERKLIGENTISVKELYEVYYDKPITRKADFLDFKNKFAIARAFLKRAPHRQFILPRKKGGAVDLVAEQGYEFLIKAKKDDKIKDIPVIMYSNLNTEKDIKKSKDLGVAGYIYKSMAKPEDLLQAIKKLKI